MQREFEYSGSNVQAVILAYRTEANNMQSGCQTDICVLDFAKAFDK